MGLPSDKLSELEASDYMSQYRSHVARSLQLCRSPTYTQGNTRHFFPSLLLPEQGLALEARHPERAGEAHHSKERGGAAGVLQKNLVPPDTGPRSPDPDQSRFDLSMEPSLPHLESLALPQFRVRKRGMATTNPSVVFRKSL